jgi:hypothetical protein
MELPISASAMAPAARQLVSNPIAPFMKTFRASPGLKPNRAQETRPFPDEAVAAASAHDSGDDLQKKFCRSFPR